MASARSRRGSWLLSVLVLPALGGLLQPSCLVRRDSEGAADDVQRCASCHGDPERPGDFLERSAPPNDLLGASHFSYPGVGAHQRHLTGSERHAPVPCAECHRVPERVDSPGHADDARPAEIVFGALAENGERTPHYDFVARTCAGTWCHGEGSAVWTEPRSEAETCGTCHGLPPPAPHPQSEKCFACHGQVIDADRRFVDPSLHVNGTVEHASGECTTCHGGSDGPAPPSDTLGNDATSAIGVGAHQAHLHGGAAGRPVACAECHSVPGSAESHAHVDGLPAEVLLGGVAATRDHRPHWDRASATCRESWCHGPGLGSESSSPSWTDQTPLDCQSCHGLPPPAPHPQMPNCELCHGDVVGENLEIVARERHVDGRVDVELRENCTLCHGDTNAAPPFALDGSTSTASPGVGAHQVHVLGTERSRKVACGECHVVPLEVLDPLHVDSAGPAEVVFSGPALAHGASPSYEAGACGNTACHGAVFPHGHTSGGTNTAPLWTVVDGTQAACGTCHALPPPRPHPVADLNPVCNACHENIAPDNLTFTRPDLHVDGVVTFRLP